MCYYLLVIFLQYPSSFMILSVWWCGKKVLVFNFLFPARPPQHWFCVLCFLFSFPVFSHSPISRSSVPKNRFPVYNIFYDIPPRLRFFKRYFSIYLLNNFLNFLFLSFFLKKNKLFFIFFFFL